MKAKNLSDYVTNESLDKKLKKLTIDIAETILEGVGSMFEDSKREHEKQHREANFRFDKLEAGQKDLQRQVNDLNADTPTQKEVDALKAKVDRHFPAS